VVTRSPDSPGPVINFRQQRTSMNSGIKVSGKQRGQIGGVQWGGWWLVGELKKERRAKQIAGCIQNKP